MTNLEIILLVASIILFIGNFIWLFVYLDLAATSEFYHQDRNKIADDRDHYKEISDYFEENHREEYEDYLLREVRIGASRMLGSRIANNDCLDAFTYSFPPRLYQGSPLYRHLIKNDITNKTTEELEKELEERKLKKDYPLAYDIKNSLSRYIEIYINGKFKDKYTRDYAWTWAKSYANNYEWAKNDNVYELSDKKEEEK